MLALVLAGLMSDVPEKVYTFDDALTPTITESAIVDDGRTTLSTASVEVGVVKRCELVVSPSGNHLFLFVLSDTPGQIGLSGSLFVFTTGPLKSIGHIRVRSNSGAPQWDGDSRILFNYDGSSTDYEVVSISEGKLLASFQDKPSLPRVVRTHAEILENLKRIQARPPIGSATYPVFRENQLTSERNKIAVSSSEEQVAFLGTVGNPKSDGASCLYLLEKGKGWSPELLGVFANGDYVAFRADYLIVGFLNDGVLRHFMYSLERGSWIYLGRARAVDVSNGTAGGWPDWLVGRVTSAVAARRGPGDRTERFGGLEVRGFGGRCGAASTIRLPWPANKTFVRASVQV